MTNPLRHPPLWEVPDGLWDRIVPILDQVDPPDSTGRPRVDERHVLNGIIFRMRTGCQWNHLPKVFGDDSTVHRHFQRWVKLGVFEKIWALLVGECQDLGDIQWEWQSADTRSGKARLGGGSGRPEPHGSGQERHQTSLLVEGRGGPLSVVVAAANVHDTKLLDQTLEVPVVDRPEPTPAEPENLCLDKAYDNLIGEITVEKHGYVGHIRRIGEEKAPGWAKRKKRFPARRWVVERTLAWLSKCRELLIRYEKKAENYVGLLSLACSLLWYRRIAFHSY